MFWKEFRAASDAASHYRPCGFRLGSGLPYRLQAGSCRQHGKVLDTIVIYPTAPQNKVEESKKILKEMIHKYNISLISVGNGTASRESEQVIVELLKEIKEPVKYVIVNEAGASVYSASKLATEEFPAFDVGQRSAVSIARRLQDPGGAGKD